MDAESETDRDLSDDGEELVSDKEVALLAQCVCLNDLSALMEESQGWCPAQLVRKDCCGAA
jgi:hypothetical protein